MRTALYVFLGILAAYAVIFMFEQLRAFVRKVNRKTDYQGYQPTFNPRPYNNYSYSDSPIIYELRDTLDRIEGMLSDFDIDHNKMKEKLDLLIEDVAELMIDKERPQE